MKPNPAMMRVTNDPVLQIGGDRCGCHAFTERAAAHGQPIT
ncbi:hypothetical protein [Paraburkholderia sp. BL21I4N1]|nr:hypothetical protein [Paraburkholderia sp. BL21I4N1]